MAHALQLVPPRAGWNFPATHARHVAAARVAENVPAAHRWQCELSLERSPNLPAGQDRNQGVGAGVGCTVGDVVGTM
jgi:hypothetical protein